MGRARSTKYNAKMQGVPSRKQHQSRAGRQKPPYFRGDRYMRANPLFPMADSLILEGGSKDGWVRVELSLRPYRHGAQAHLRVFVLAHPDEPQEFLTELYSGTLDAERMYELVKAREETLAENRGRDMVAELLKQSNAPVTPYPLTEDLFYYDTSEEENVDELV